MAQSTTMDLETIHVLVHINLHNPTPHGPLTFSLTDSQLLRSAPTWHRLPPAILYKLGDTRVKPYFVEL